jgi:putative RecB family exonuclease
VICDGNAKFPVTDCPPFSFQGGFMDLAELRKLPHLSASAIGTYIDCSLKYKLAKIDRLAPDFISDSLIYGSVIHQLLEIYHEARMHDETIPLSEWLELFERHWFEALEKAGNIKFNKDATAETLLNEGKSLLTIYYDRYPREYKVMATEMPFSFTLDGLPIVIIGAIDLIEEDESGTIIITDHKTSGRAFSNDEVNRNMQLTLYQMAMKEQYPDRDFMLKLDALIKTKTPRFEQFYTFRDELAEQRLKRKILAVWNGIEKEVFIPNEESWFCKGCEYKSHCNNWFEERRAA